MNLVKWIRKNERKLMTWLLVLIMIAFVGGSALQRILSSVGGQNQVIAHYDGGKKITVLMINQAKSELELLKGLMADKYLMYNQSILSTPDRPRFDFTSQMLAQMLFNEPGLSEMLSQMLKQNMADSFTQMTSEEIDEFFTKAGGRSDYYWILLKEEAKNAGCAVSLEAAKDTLKLIIPKMTQGRATAGQVVNAIRKNSRISEEGILTVYADLLSVMTYGNIITRSENLTIDEVKATAGRMGESIDADYVKIAAIDFADDQPEPTAAEINEQFASFKNFKAGYCSDENPYGFGYKLPARVKLEYMILKLKDVEGLVAEPTHEEMGDYYRQNKQIFKLRTPPVDPEDPTAVPEEKYRTYAESTSQIKSALTRERMLSKADMIITDATDMTDAGFGDLDMLTVSSDEIKSLAKDYNKVAEALTEKYGIKLYAGSTGMLSPEELASDFTLRSLSLDVRSSEPVSVIKMAFAVEELEVTKPGPFDPAAPKMWANIGPFKDRSYIALVRVVDTAKASVPESIDYSYSINGVDLSGQAEEKTYSVKEQVANDVKLLKAMDVAAARADELAKLAGEKEWQEAITEMNDKYAEKKDDVVVGKRLFSQKMTRRKRPTSTDEKAAYSEIAARPGVAKRIYSSMVVSGKLVENIYGLIPAGELEATGINKVMKFEPEASYYVVKDVSRTSTTIQDYAKQKAPLTYMIDMAGGEAMALHHYRPDNLFARMGFEPVLDEEEELEDGEETEKK